MNKTYFFVGIVCVFVVGGVLYWQVQSKKTSDNSIPPTNTQIPSQQDTPTITLMKPKSYSTPPPMTIDPNKTYIATIVTDKGSMKVPLFAKDAPVTVNNFIFLARDGFYTNTIFHRVISGFMIQGGDPRGDGTGGPGYKFADEKITRDYTRGTIAMANSGPNTNGSQFFIMHATYSLRKNYVIFGSIDATDSASLATLDAIASSPVVESGSELSKPVTPTMVSSVTIEEK